MPTLDTADPTTSTLADLASAIRAGKLSPVELTRAYLARIARLDATLRAYITVDGDGALAAAAALEREAA
ncbi:MAG TPA: Asp-tRNA(Asn)/Glu-tRNA(Gln) amidotransferase GatCAB subunit A, partial [Methylomirabilota bacterium]|nr:Asp-tRNA(Asn)/Glu-tRNA(Gln) amidotransferase GatCAB subunit A [Methylomirabilota bacterium]